MIDKLSAFMSINRLKIAVVTESWFSEEIEDSQVLIGGYVIHRRDRMNCRGGGVCVYVSKHLPTRRRFDRLEDPQQECI